MSRKLLPINIATLNKIKIREFIDSFEVILTDCDGKFLLTLETISVVDKTPLYLIPIYHHGNNKH